MLQGLANVPLPIDGFLSWLRAQGFVIGVDSHLRVQQLLERAGPECSPQDLKTVLCPLFARSEEQQDAFYRSFDRWFDLFAAPAAPDSMRDPEPGYHPPPPSFKPRSKANRWPYAAGAGMVLVLAAAVTFWVTKTPSRPQPHSAPGTVTTSAQDTPPAAEAPPPVLNQPQPSQPEPPTPPPAVSQSFSETHLALTRWALTMAPLLLYLLYELRRLSRRRYVLQKQKGRKGPYSWPVRVQSKPRVYHSAQFYAAARRLQRRQRGESLSLDVDGSVEATIDSFGFPILKYKSDSRLPEYLILIDRTSFRDHQAHLFEALGRALQEEGLFVTPLFFDGDPRVCQTETMDGDFYLVDLERRHSGDRLIVFGDGERLIDPVSGRLAGWAALFQSWNDRAVLTPVAPSAWGLNEKALASQFIVLPASVDGLLALVDHFEQSARSDLRSWRENSGEPDGPNLDSPLLVPRLREYLGAPAFEWLCACAVYPELHWDLTLHLGSLPGVAENPINETNLLRLIRLPWFRSGSIPDEVRWTLIQELGPARQNAVREAILQLLEECPPPKESFAGDFRGFQIVLQRYCLNRRDRQRRREFVEALKSLPQTERLGDHTTLGALESMRLTTLDFVLPRAMRRMLFANGLPAFGLKNSLRLLVVAPVCLFLCLVFTISFLKNNVLEARVRSAERAPALVELPAADLATIDSLQRLENLRQTLAMLQTYRHEGAPWSYHGSPYVGDTLYPEARRIYFDRFRQAMFGPAQDAILQNLKGLPASPVPEHEYQPTYDSLKAYLITTSFHDKGTRLFLTPVLMAWWTRGRSVDPGRQSLARKQFDFYVEALKEENPYSSGNDTLAIERARSYLKLFAGAERVYAFMLAEADKAGKPINFNRDFPGSAAVVVNTYDVRGAFSTGGRKFMMDAIAHADRYFNGEPWVLGEQGSGNIDRAQLDQDLRSRYYNDWVKAWTAYIKAAIVVRYAGLKDAALKLKQLSSNLAPLLEMLSQASRNTAGDDPNSKLFQPVQFVTPLENSDKYVAPSNQNYISALVQLQSSIASIADQPPNDAAAAQTLQVARQAEGTVRQMAQSFRIDSPIQAIVQKLLMDPITNVEALLKIEKTGTEPTSSTSAPVAMPPRSYALVVGVSKYINLPDRMQLPYAERDSQLMYTVLISPGGGNFKAENVHLLTNEKATLASLRQEINVWLTGVAKEDDRVLIYFAGHAFIDGRSGKGYLAPSDIDRNNIASTAYPMDELGGAIGGKIRAKSIILLTDAAHSGAITPVDTQTLNHNLSGLGRSVFSLTACRDREVSFEGPSFGGGHGVFTYYVVQGMQGAADTTPRDGVVTADELAEYVHAQVREATGGRQNPTSEKGSFDPAMFIALVPANAPPGVAPAPRFGTLVFESNMDDVTVLMDGKTIGVASRGKPLSMPGLTPGAHMVQGVHDGYQPDGPKEETVYPGQTSTVSIKILIPRRQ